MSTNQDTSTTQFITTKGPNGPSETKDPDDKPPTPGPDETKEPKETKAPKETKEPKETKDPDDKPPTPEPDTTSGFSLTNTNYNDTDIDKSISTTTTTTTPISSTTDIYEPTWDLFDNTYYETVYETIDETIDETFPIDTNLLSTYDDPDTEKPTKPPKATKAPTTAKPTKAPKGTKAPTTPKPTKAPKYNRTKLYEPGSNNAVDNNKGGHPDVHTDLLTYKQSLGVISVVTVFLLIIFALLQIFIHPDCRKNFKKGQLGNKQGKILFYSFIVALFFFLLNSIFFVHFIFTIDTLSDTAYAIEEIFSMVPYRLGKLMMSVFFILRLHFVFKEAAFKINIYMIATLITSSVIGTILGCLGGIFGPLKTIKPQNGVNIATLIGVISLGITIIVDIIVMILYNHRLHLVVLMQGELSTRSKSFRRRTTRGESVADMGLDGRTTPKFSKLKSAEGIELQTQTQRRKGNTWTNVSNDEIELRKNTSIIPITPTADYDDLDDGGVLTDDDGYGEWEHFEVVETEVVVDALMVKTITKSTLLSLIGILTSFWLHIELLMMAIWTEDDGVRVRAIASVDGGINLICMYLVFAFAKPYYEIGCKLCHSTMQRCCRWSAKRAVVRSKSQSEISQL